MSNWFQRKIENIQRDHRRKRYAEGEFFRIYSGDGIDYRNDLIAIEVLRGKFKGVVYSYTTCDISDDGRCNFDIRVIETPNIEEKILVKNRNFSKIVGQILLMILDDAISMEKNRYESESGEDYIEEPVQSRTVHQKNSSISEE